jgi:hypothetical protein
VQLLRPRRYTPTLEQVQAHETPAFVTPKCARASRTGASARLACFALSFPQVRNSGHVDQLLTRISWHSMADEHVRVRPHKRLAVRESQQHGTLPAREQRQRSPDRGHPTALGRTESGHDRSGIALTNEALHQERKPGSASVAN